MKKSFLIILSFFLSFVTIAQSDSTSNRVREIGITTSTFNNFGLTYRIGKSTAVWRINGIYGGYNNSNSHNNDEHNEYEYTDSSQYIINEESALNSEEYDNKSKSFNYGIAIGREFRKNLSKKLYLRYGMDIHFNHSYTGYEQGNNFESTYENDNYYSFPRNHKISQYTFGGNLILGLNYHVNDNFIIGAEITPSIRYNITKQESKSSTIEYSITDDNMTDIKETNTHWERDSSSWNTNLSNSSVLLSFIYQF